MNCDSAKFVVYKSHAAGVGSNIHVMGFHAVHAWKAGRLILWGETLGEGYTDRSTCGDRTNFLCHFLPPSNCTLAHALARRDTVFAADSSNPLNPDKPDVNRDYLSYIPAPIMALIEAASLEFKHDELKYWWRAQVLGGGGSDGRVFVSPVTRYPRACTPALYPERSLLCPPKLGSPGRHSGHAGGPGSPTSHRRGNRIFAARRPACVPPASRRRLGARAPR